MDTGLKNKSHAKLYPGSVAVPGFPLVGCRPVLDVADLQHGQFSVETCAKMKELCPGGGGGERRRLPRDPPMTWGLALGW